MIKLDRALLTAAKLETIELQYGPGETVYEHGARAQFVYAVDEGALVRLRLLSKNRSSTSEFLFPGEGFGFEIDRNHRDTVQTLRPSKLFAARKEDLLNAATTDRRLANLLFSAAVRAVLVAEEQGHRLRTMAATEHIALFLIEMERRQSVSRKIDLPMTRHHLADYLGVTIETVSRVLNVLQEEGVIQCLDARHRQIIIRDERRLQRLASDASDFDYWRKRNGRKHTTTRKTATWAG